MPVVPVPDVLAYRLAVQLPGFRPPAPLLQRLAETLGDEEVQLLVGDLRPLGFGAYEGQLCLVTPARVLLVTATRAGGQEGAFGLETWDREVTPLPRVAPVLPRSPLPES